MNAAMARMVAVRRVIVSVGEVGDHHEVPIGVVDAEIRTESIVTDLGDQPRHRAQPRHDGVDVPCADVLRPPKHHHMANHCVLPSAIRSSARWVAASVGVTPLAAASSSTSVVVS